MEIKQNVNTIRKTPRTEITYPTQQTKSIESKKGYKLQGLTNSNPKYF